jgi:hypothetical protein
MSDVTALLDRWNAGDPQALKELIALVHGELRRQAGSLLRHEPGDHTFQPTDLVHEAYLRLSGLRAMPLSGRRHSYGAAAEAMRRILVDHARGSRCRRSPSWLAITPTASNRSLWCSISFGQVRPRNSPQQKARVPLLADQRSECPVAGGTRHDRGARRGGESMCQSLRPWP